MKKSICVFIVFLLAYGSVVGAEEEIKPSPTRDFLYELNEEGSGVIITGYLGKASEVNVPAIIKTFPVLELQHVGSEYDGLFPKFVKKVNLPEGLKVIGKKVFRESGIESITIPDSVKEIGYDAFCECVDLKTVFLGEGVEIIGNSAFLWCFNLSTFNIRTIREIRYGNAASFAGCTNLSDESKEKIIATGYNDKF